MPKPTSLAAAEQAADHISTALEHTSDVFSFAAATAVAAVTAVEPDLTDPPGSVLTSVLSGVEPHATIDFPDGALGGFEHASLPQHVSDWFVS